MRILHVPLGDTTYLALSSFVGLFHVSSIYLIILAYQHFHRGFILFAFPGLLYIATMFPDFRQTYLSPQLQLVLHLKI